MKNFYQLSSIFLKQWYPLITLALLIFGIFAYSHWYIPYKHRKEGFVVVNTFDCPDYYSIKAHLGSMIYHEPGDPYYARTSASNGDCFDTANHAIQQGFRASYNP
jgi:hypothetical protein